MLATSKDADSLDKHVFDDVASTIGQSLMRGGRGCVHVGAGRADVRPPAGGGPDRGHADVRLPPQRGQGGQRAARTRVPAHAVLDDVNFKLYRRLFIPA